MIRRASSPIDLLALFALFAAAVPAAADPYVVVRDDRAAFAALLDVDPLSSVTDTGGAFAADPAAAAGLASVSRSGFVAGQAFAYTVHDIDFSNAPTGVIAPGVPGNDIADLDALNVETPAAQGGATGSGSFGFDGSGGGGSTRNALLVDFTTTPGGLGVGHFGLDLIDFEASTGFVPAWIRLYSAGVLVFSQTFGWDPQTGNDQVHFLGVVAVAQQGGARFTQAVIVVGDDNGVTGFGESWAADRLTFGAAVHNPEPGTFALFGSGLAALAALCARRRAARRGRGVGPRNCDTVA
ncbi:MAG: hypothetical protein HMLKMBBP_02227 [Planctomycetes bacterium]|nr:hypothetical protein [Planctomycetota bacterium]